MATSTIPAAPDDHADPASPKTPATPTTPASRAPRAIEVRGARVHNLKTVDIDIPLQQIVGIAGVSGSGKSSLALGVLYAEGSRRYLEALSTYTRRRLTQAAAAQVDAVRYIPAALALHQRPGVPGIRSTFGTSTELLNSLRLMFSRLAHHRCPNGHYVKPTLKVAAEQEILCPVCGAQVHAPSAEELAFNSQGACPKCGGTGIVRTVDRSTLVPDESLTIDDGAVMPWRTLMWSLMTDVCRAMGVRTDVPFSQLTPEERDIVFNGPAVKKHIFYHPKGANDAAELDFTYYNAVYTVENALSKVKDEKGMKRVERFLKEDTCPACGGSRLSEAARAPRVRDISLAQACEMTLAALVRWVAGIPETLPEEMRPMAESIGDAFQRTARRLVDLGLSYLTLDRASSTLSTGERQRTQLARAVRNRTTGVLYVLDEPSIGMHPANLEGLCSVFDDLVADGNSIILVDHDTQVLHHADWIIELGPGAGADGGKVIAEGTVAQIEASKASKIGPFLARHEGDRGSAVKSAPAAEEPAVKSAHTVDNAAVKSASTADDTTAKSAPKTGNGKTVKSAPPHEGAAAKSAPASDDSAFKSARETVPADALFALGTIHLSTDPIHTVHALDVDIPRGRLTVVTGVSGSGKTTLILESLIPGLEAKIADRPLLFPVRAIDAPGIHQVKLIDATPIGINIRSTVATYANVHDELRKVYAKTPEAKERGYKAGDFSYNTGALRCPVCDGTGSISLDVQFLPDVDITCPECGGSRYGHEAFDVRRENRGGELYSLPRLMEMSVDEALVACDDLPSVRRRLNVLHDMGLGYLTLGEQTPGLSGGEAQRLKLASEMGRGQDDTLFVFDEPTIGLHPLDVLTLLKVFQRLIDAGATVIVIEHDLDVIRSADYVIDMGPGGGVEGGRVVAVGTPRQISENPESITGRYLSINP